jgi:hypothetical protein
LKGTSLLPCLRLGTRYEQTIIISPVSEGQHTVCPVVDCTTVKGIYARPNAQRLRGGTTLDCN